MPGAGVGEDEDELKRLEVADAGVSGELEPELDFEDDELVARFSAEFMKGREVLEPCPEDEAATIDVDVEEVMFRVLLEAGKRSVKSSQSRRNTKCTYREERHALPNRIQTPQAPQRDDLNAS